MLSDDPNALLARIARLEAQAAAMRPDRSAYVGKNGVSISGASGNMIVDAAELSRRLDSIERDLSARIATLERTLTTPQPNLSMLTQVGGVLRWQPVPASSDQTATTGTLATLTLNMSATVDDDIRVRIGGVTVFDPQQVGSGRLQVTLDAAAVLLRGAPITPGSLVQIDTYDGFASSYSLRKWSAIVSYSNGATKAFVGGRDFNGTSTTVPTHHANGSFIL